MCVCVCVCVSRCAGLNVVFDEVDTDNTAGVGSERALHFSELEAMLRNDGSEGLLGVAREIFQEVAARTHTLCVVLRSQRENAVGG